MSSRSAWCRCCKLSSSSLCWVRSSSSFRTWETARGAVWRAGRQVPQATWRSLPHSDSLLSSAAPHLGLQVCQPGLTLQKLSLELGSASLKLHLGSQQLLLVFCAWQQAPPQGLWEQGL